MIATAKAIVAAASITAVSVALWAVIVQPKIDLLENQRDEAQRQVEAADRRYAYAQALIGEMEKELKYRQQVLDLLEAAKQTIATNLRTTEARIQEAIDSGNSPELVACLDMPVADFHRSVRGVPEASPARD